MIFSGRQHPAIIEYCDCPGQPDITTILVELNLWPASPVMPRVAISSDLMQLCHCFFIECKVPLQGFLRAISQTQSMYAPHHEEVI